MKPERARSEQRQRQVMLAARVNSDEERLIREAAKARNVSVASLIRSAVLAAVEQPSLPGGGTARQVTVPLNPCVALPRSHNITTADAATLRFSRDICLPVMDRTRCGYLT